MGTSELRQPRATRVTRSMRKTDKAVRHGPPLSLDPSSARPRRGSNSRTCCPSAKSEWGRLSTADSLEIDRAACEARKTQQASFLGKGGIRDSTAGRTSETKHARMPTPACRPKNTTQMHTPLAPHVCHTSRPVHDGQPGWLAWPGRFFRLGPRFPTRKPVPKP